MCGWGLLGHTCLQWVEIIFKKHFTSLQAWSSKPRSLTHTNPLVDGLSWKVISAWDFWHLNENSSGKKHEWDEKHQRHLFENLHLVIYREIFLIFLKFLFVSSCLLTIATYDIWCDDMYVKLRKCRCKYKIGNTSSEAVSTRCEV